MRRFLALGAGALGVGTLLRRLRRRSAPADELRAKLAESRSIADERDVAEAGETSVDAAPDPVSDVDARRAEVHDRARQSLDELQ